MVKYSCQAKKSTQKKMIEKKKLQKFGGNYGK